jgi:hypothetical protein
MAADGIIGAGQGPDVLRPALSSTSANASPGHYQRAEVLGAQVLTSQSRQLKIKSARTIARYGKP